MTPKALVNECNQINPLNAKYVHCQPVTEVHRSVETPVDCCVQLLANKICWVAKCGLKKLNGK